MNSHKTTPIRQISLICVPTREQDRAIAFYESLGFEKRTDNTFGPGYRWVEVYPPQGSTGVALAPPPGNDPIAPANTGITLTTNDIDASHAQFKALGVDVDHEVSRMGDPVPPMFWFRDPSGHTLMVVEQKDLSEAASDESLDFTELVERHRAELHAHCYRMLGSVHDADDALQDTLLRVWRGAAGLRDAGSARSWLYSIASNVCLTEIERRRKRMLPHEFGRAAAPHTPPGAPEIESTWIEPYPSEGMRIAPGRVNPEASYEQREGLELAFVAALQHLAATQRAMLILREVMGFSASEVATMLQTTVASVNSGLQRARAAVRARVDPHTQQRALRSLGDGGLHRLVERYVEAWERNDVDAFTALLVEDATFAMPPLTTWYAPRETIAIWAREFPLSGAWRWKPVLTEANAQPALAFYSWDEAAEAYLPFALNVLSFREGLVSDVTAFIVRATGAPEPEAYQRFPDEPIDRRQLSIAFERFGLPDRLT